MRESRWGDMGAGCREEQLQQLVGVEVASALVAGGGVGTLTGMCRTWRDVGRLLGGFIQGPSTLALLAFYAQVFHVVKHT